MSRGPRSPGSARLAVLLGITTVVLALVALMLALTTGARGPATAEPVDAGHHAGLGHGPGGDPQQDQPAATPATDTTAPESAAVAVPSADAAAPPASGSAPAPRASSSAATPPASASVASKAVGRPKAAPPAATGGAAPVRAGTWLSGAGGTGVASGAFGDWRGRPVDIAGTWADNDTAQVQLWQLGPGGEYASWTKSLDIAVGAIDAGETWGQAAQGAYDDRWRQSLTNLRALWGSRSGTLYIRFAHEINSNWYPWSVQRADVDSFVTAWKRFRALQQQIFPAAKLVFSVNRESVGTGIDWRTTFPGARYVDVMSVDYYNQYPYVATEADWDASVNQTDATGAPKGLQQHLDFARSVGLPLAVSEWSGKASQGDSPAFIQGMHDFFAAHAGGGAGQLLYEIQFNVDMNDNDYRLFGGTKMPASAAAYQAAF